MKNTIQKNNRDYLDLTQEELKTYFDKALRNYSTSEARIIWGLLDKDITEKRVDYLRILSVEEKYSEMKAYMSKFGVAMPLREQLIAFAYAGDREAFTEYYKKGRINSWYLAFLMIVLDSWCSDMSEEQFEEMINDWNSGKYIMPSTLDSEDGNDYLNIGLWKVAKIWDIILEEDSYSDVINDAERRLLEEKKRRYYGALYRGFSKTLNIEKQFYLCVNSINDMVDTVEPYILRGKKNTRTVVDFFFRVFDLHIDDRAIKYAKTYLGYLKTQYGKLQRKGEHHIVGEIKKLYIRAFNSYIMIHGKTDKEIEEFLHYMGVFDIPFDEQIDIRRITRIVSKKGQIAYDSAYKLYKLAMDDEFGFSDAGPVSLAFYRIIESESSDRIWKPLIRNIGEDTLEDKAREQYKSINDPDKANAYKTKWVGTKKKRGAWADLCEKTKAEKGLMLGDLCFYTEFVRNNRNTDKVAGFLFDEMKKVLTDSGLEALKSGKLSMLYSKENREKYRNPPAHNTYLSRKMLSDCRSFVETQLMNLSEWCKYREFEP